MCGIVGFVGSGDQDNLIRMADAVAHRGPDSAGFYVDSKRGVYLGHRRLSVVDIGGGAQPMWNEARDICVIFNGEIYNHLELRQELIRCGHIFESHHSDTEVLIHGYEEWGESLPSRLNGMFAFVIYDQIRGRLFAARDRFGKKPFFYSKTHDGFAFASELKALQQHPAIASPVSALAVQKLFAYGFIPAPNSLYENIYKLPGGHILSVDIATGELQICCYWRFELEEPATIPANADEIWGEELRWRLSEAVRRRLVADVPIGIFLSGGIDSSAVLAYAARHLPADRLETYAIGFHEPSFDESTYARRVANYFGTTHFEEILSLDTARELIPHILSRLDEPLGDSSIVPTYLLCRFARQRITVALSGDGGDELFAGYDPFKALDPARLYHATVPPLLHALLRKMAGLLPVSTRNMSLEFKLKRSLRGLGYTPDLWNPVWLGPLEPSELNEVFAEPAPLETIYEEAITAWQESRAKNLVDKTLEFYTKLYLQDNILTKTDRASMLVSLEVRSPFLDNDVVEFARKLPNTAKLRGNNTKHLLKTALRSMLPDEILSRKKKGFGIPISAWLREWESVEMPDWLDGIVKAKSEQRKWKEHKSGGSDHRMFLWCLLTLAYHGS